MLSLEAPSHPLRFHLPLSSAYKKTRRRRSKSLLDPGVEAEITPSPMACNASHFISKDSKIKSN